MRSMIESAVARERAIAQIDIISGDTSEGVLAAVAREERRREKTAERFVADVFVENVVADLKRQP